MELRRIRSLVFAKYLEKKGLWTEEDTARVKEEAKATVNEAYQKSRRYRENDDSGLIDRCSK